MGRWVLFLVFGFFCVVDGFGAEKVRREEFPEPCDWEGVKIPSWPGTSVMVCRKKEVLLTQNAWAPGTCEVKGTEGLPTFVLITGPNGLHWVTAAGETLIYPTAEPEGFTTDYPKNQPRSARPEKTRATVSTYYEREKGEWRMTVIGGAPLRSIIGECRTGGYIQTVKGR